MRMMIGSSLLVALLAVQFGAHDATAQEGKELTPYSLVEIKNLLDNFKSTYKKKKVPQRKPSGASPVLAA